MNSQLGMLTIPRERERKKERKKRRRRRTNQIEKKKHTRPTSWRRMIHQLISAIASKIRYLLVLNQRKEQQQHTQRETEKDRER